MRVQLSWQAGGALSEPVIPNGIRVVYALLPGGLRSELRAPALDAIIDTGASRSCIPSALSRDAEGNPVLEVVDYRQPIDWQGSRAPSPVPVYLVWVELVGHGPFSVTPYETDDASFIIGRDLLAHFLTALDGPSQTLGVRATNKLDRLVRSLLRAP